jgi:putative PIN family toxin of toxin-antitoxin system
MRVVLDTNVLIGALLSAKGAPAEIVRRWQAEVFRVIISPPLLAEFKRVTAYAHGQKYLRQPQEEVAAFLRRLGTVATLVEPDFSLSVITKDPEDDRVLECALAGDAAYVVSGNKHLLELQRYNNIIILNPVGFLAVLQVEIKK